MDNKYRKRFGARGEEIARDYLVGRGFKVLDSNFLIWGGEIDLICRDNNFYVFVEVKTKRDEKYSFLEESISKKKTRFLKRASQHWLHRKGLTDAEWRIDFVGVILEGDNVKEIRHYPNSIY